MRLADYKDEDGAAARSGSVRDAFNSPFRPFVLATTSVGQEGLDFLLEFGGEFFVGVEGEGPGAAAEGDGEIFLRGEALPGVLDDLSTGRFENIAELEAEERFELRVASVIEPEVVERCVTECQAVFHLASAVRARLASGASISIAVTVPSVPTSSAAIAL